MFNTVAKQQIIIKKHKARDSWLTMTLKFLYENNLPKDLKSKRSVGSFAAKT